MKGLLFFCALWALSFAQANNFCYNTLEAFCSSDLSSNERLTNCSACYGGFAKEGIVHDVQSYANSHIAVSFDYLLLATNFGSYVKDRKGFEKLFRHLSDSTWEDGIDLIKYISKRGGSMDFYRMLHNTEYAKPAAALNEIQGLARALDIHKNLATQSFDLHMRASGKENHEPEVASYLETKFLHKHADIIRSLSGHISDVKQLISQPEQKSLSLFLFDEYLQEHYM